MKLCQQCNKPIEGKVHGNRKYHKQCHIELNATIMASKYKPRVSPMIEQLCPCCGTKFSSKRIRKFCSIECKRNTENPIKVAREKRERRESIARLKASTTEIYDIPKVKNKVIKLHEIFFSSTQRFSFAYTMRSYDMKPEVYKYTMKRTDGAIHTYKSNSFTTDQIYGAIQLSHKAYRDTGHSQRKQTRDRLVKLYKGLI